VLGVARNPFNNWSDIAVRHGVDTGQWPAADIGVVRDQALMGRLTLAYGRVLAFRKDAAAAGAALDRMKAFRTQIAAAMPTEWPDDHESATWLDRAVAQGEAVVALARGEEELGVEIFVRAGKRLTGLTPPGEPLLRAA